MAKSKKENTNPFVFTELERYIHAFRLPVDEDADSYAEAYRALYSTTFVAMELNMGKLARLKGSILNKLYHVDPAQRDESLMKRGEWGEFRKTLSESEDTLVNYRKIADRFPLDDRGADKMGVVEMLTMIRADDALESGEAKKPRERKQKKNKGENVEPLTLPAASIKLIEVKSGLLHIAKSLSDLDKESICAKPNETESKLMQAETFLKELPSLIEEVQKAIEGVRETIVKYQRERKSLSQNRKHDVKSGAVKGWVDLSPRKKEVVGV